MSEQVQLTPRHLFNLTEGQRVEWCKTHNASFFDLDRCGYYLWNEPIYEGDPDPGECVVASLVLVDIGVVPVGEGTEPQ